MSTVNNSMYDKVVGLFIKDSDLDFDSVNEKSHGDVGLRLKAKHRKAYDILLFLKQWISQEDFYKKTQNFYYRV